MSLPASLILSASLRGGALTTSHARKAGMPGRELRRAVERGEAVRVRRDAFILGDVWQAARYPEERLALATRAVLLTRPRDVASHSSALALQGLPIRRAGTRLIDLISDVAQTRTLGRLRLHPLHLIPEVDRNHLVDERGAAHVSVALAVRQVLDQDGADAAIVPLDAALHRGLLTLSSLTAQCPDCWGTPAAERLLALAAHRCESVGETLLKILLYDADLPFRTQVRLYDEDGFVGRVDALVGATVVVEFDGATKYAGADGDRNLVSEKRREDRLRSLGYHVIRVTWDELADGAALVARIRRAVAAAA